MQEDEAILGGEKRNHMVDMAGMVWLCIDKDVALIALGR